MSLKRGIFYTFLTQAPTLVLFFISSTLMSRILGDEGRGAYALLTNQVALFSVLLWFNLTAGITYFTSKAKRARSTIVGTATTVLLADLILIALVLFGIHQVNVLQDVFMPEMASHWSYYLYVYLSIALGLIQSAISAVLLGLKQFKVLNIMSILGASVSAAAFLVLFLWVGDRSSADMVPYVLGLSLGILLLLMIVWCIYYALIVGIVPRPTFSLRELRPVFLFSSVGYLSILINMINYRFDIWVVDHFNGTAALGLYSVAVGLGQLLFNIPEPFSRVIQPFLYGQKQDDMISRFKLVARMNFTFVACAAIGLGAVAGMLVPLLFGEVFAGSVPALRLLLPGILFSSATKMLATLVIQKGFQRFNLYATMAGALVTIVLDLLLIPHWGIMGAAVASSASYFVILVLVLLTIRSKIGMSIRDLFILKPADIRLLRTAPPWRTMR